MKLADITTEDITTLVGLLTEVQKDELVGVYYSDDSIYNPIQDIDNNWVISTEEMLYTTNPDTLWVKDLELIEYKPRPTPSPF
jgi:DNA-binding MltR family transcriptional regulator